MGEIQISQLRQSYSREIVRPMFEKLKPDRHASPTDIYAAENKSGTANL